MDGSGIRIEDESGTFLNFSAQSYTQEDLEIAKHIHELPQRNLITLNIDLNQRGVGGDIPAVAMLHEEYKLKKITYIGINSRLNQLKTKCINQTIY